MATEPLDPPSVRPSRPVLTPVRLVPLDDIKVPAERLRTRLDIENLRESIAANGLLQPLVLDESLTLVCGLHRLEACRALGWNEVAAIVRAWSGLEAQLAEVDENLCRRELSALERAEHLALRRTLWLQLRTERAANDPPGEKQGKTKKPKARSAREEMAELSVFVDDAAKKTGRAASTVREEIRIGELPADVRRTVRETSLGNNRRELLALTRMAEDEQRAAIERVRSGESKSVRRKAPRGADESAESAPLPEGDALRDRLSAMMDAGGPVVLATSSLPIDASQDALLLEALDAAGRALDRALELWRKADGPLADGESPGGEVLRQAAVGVHRLVDDVRRRRRGG